MILAFAVVDLFYTRERLMPWRTVMEVALYVKKMGHEVVVLTLPVSVDNVEYEYDGIHVKVAPRDFYAFAKYVNKYNFDALYYPTPWREGLKDLSAFSLIKCRKIAYFPGGSVHLNNVLALGKNVGWKAAKPYMIDWLTPYNLTMKKLKDSGFSTIIVQSPYTADTCLKGGFQDVRMIVPGKDDFEKLEESPDLLYQLNVEGKKYLLFAGAPAPIRGASLLLKALEKAIDKDPSIRCLFLMRRDVGTDFKDFANVYTRVRHKENIIISYVKLERDELKTVVAHARAVALPFLLVPSEIPITFFEVLSVGIPVVTFENGGTTDYLDDCVLISSPGKVDGLVENILRIWQDDTLYEKMRHRALKKMENHPTWEVVAQRWLDCIEKR